MFEASAYPKTPGTSNACGISSTCSAPFCRLCLSSSWFVVSIGFVIVIFPGPEVINFFRLNSTELELLKANR